MRNAGFTREQKPCRAVIRPQFQPEQARAIVQGKDFVQIKTGPFDVDLVPV